MPPMPFKKKKESVPSMQSQMQLQSPQPLQSSQTSQQKNKIGTVKKQLIDSTRSWTLTQFIIVKGALLGLAITAINQENKSLKAGASLNYYRVFMIVLMFLLLIVVFMLEKWFNAHEDKRLETEDLIYKWGELQSAIFGYLIHQYLPDVPQEQVLDVIERFPHVLGIMSVGSVRKQIGEGYKVIVEAMMNIQESYKSLKEEIIGEVTTQLSPLMHTISVLRGEATMPPPTPVQNPQVQAQAQAQASQAQVQPQPQAQVQPQNPQQNQQNEYIMPK